MVSYFIYTVCTDVTESCTDYPARELDPKSAQAALGLSMMVAQSLVSLGTLRTAGYSPPACKGGGLFASLFASGRSGRSVGRRPVTSPAMIHTSHGPPLSAAAYLGCPPS